MIAIMNISEEYGLKYIPNGGSGLQKYRVQLNNIPLSEFDHNSEDGIAACVTKAAWSLMNVDIDQKIKDYHTVSWQYFADKVLKEEVSTTMKEVKTNPFYRGKSND